MTTNKIILPKEYLSWSQRDLWRKSPGQYRKRYFEDAPGFSNKYMRYGSKIGKALETRNFLKLNEYEKVAVSQLPRMEVYEYKFVSDEQGLDMPVNYIGYIDGAKEDLSVIDEYKTGKTPWDDKRVDKHGQIKDYALLVYKKTGKIPLVRLFWIETQEIKGNIEATSKVVKFERQFTIEQMEANEKEILDVALEISEAYKKWKFSDMKDLKVSVIDEYVELAFQKKDIEAQAKDLSVKMAELMEAINLDLTANSFESFAHESGNFFYTSRKKYLYPEEVVNMEMEYKKAKKESEEKLIPEITKSLGFRAKKFD